VLSRERHSRHSIVRADSQPSHRHYIGVWRKVHDDLFSEGLGPPGIPEMLQTFIPGHGQGQLV